MRRFIIVTTVAALSLSGDLAQAQVRAGTAPRSFTLQVGDDDRPRLGISTRSSGKRDTLGLLVESVTAGSPADKAGIEEGDRLVAVNAVNLRLSAVDAGEDDMEGIASRRLIRELEKHKAGDEVELRVYRDGQTRTVRARLATAEEVQGETRAVIKAMSALTDRAVLGLTLGGTGSKRDTLGVLVVGITDDGPSARAGIEEGDRIASINGVELRVAREDAGDWQASSARINRLHREMEKVKAGDDVELRIVSSGQPRTVRVKAVKASELPRESGAFFFGDGGAGLLMDRFRGVMPSVRIAPTPPVPPAPPSPSRLYFRRPGGTTIYRMEEDQRAAEAARQRVTEVQARLEKLQTELRAKADNAVWRRAAARVVRI